MIKNNASRRPKKSSGSKKRWLVLPSLAVVGVCGLCLAGLLLYQLPPVHSRLAWRVAGVQGRVQRWINPPQELVFVPQGGAPAPGEGAVSTSAAATLAQIAAEATPTAVATATPPAPAGAATDAVTAEPEPIATATLAPTPLPAAVRLSGVIHEYQQFNNCGPANLAMALSYWGWQGDQRATRAFLRPNTQVDDKNVMSAEMVAFVEGSTELQALTRVGGDVDLLRRLIAAGFPVMIEAGHHPPKDWWMGHYLVVNGYEDNLRVFTVQDSLINPDQPMTYDELGAGWWRDFNYVFVVVYPPDRESELMGLLGPLSDEAAAYRSAERRALEEVGALSGRDQFFAMFNLGSSRVGLGDYAGAAEAYDQAFKLYQALSEEMRPYRLMWYQVGPYLAYYHTGRFQDVVTLANTTFAWVGQPVLEESYYWRGMAHLALGQNNQALADFQKAAELNPNFSPPRDELAKLGAAIP